MNKNNSVEEKLAGSLTAETTELIPYLPYLLQDIWELGSDPKAMADGIKENIRFTENTRVLDLGCGKGAVSILLCKELGIHAKGIDIIPDFIEAATRKSEEDGVSHLCEFKQQDINESIKTESGYDIVILGAVGDVLGTPAETLRKLSSVIRTDGHILIDDAYLSGNQEDVKYQNYEYLPVTQWHQLFRELDLELIAQYDNGADTNREINNYNNRMIRQRANELIAKYPDQRDLFLGYVQSQEAECEDLQDHIVGVIWLLKRKG